MKANSIPPEQIELYSSAVTLSDMECFVFPELMYSLVLANIMSPVIWEWRNEDCFVRLEGKSPHRRLMRLRQYIMDEFEFNLDLNTWGLTSKQAETARFKDHISPEDIARSNALFGYEGDKYYFDVDIRRHFGLDRYDGDVIPYWKTETVEAMNAFRRKPGYKTGAGECVSLSALYAAAAFIVCRIPLEDIFMILTPLHSQNFIDIQDGVLTNNRRLVTKSMWFNGSAISVKAQRAIRNERATIVSNNTGWIHCLYGRATIEPQEYDRLRARLNDFLTTPLSAVNLASFLRANPQYHKYFQFCRRQRDAKMFVKAEAMFGYEHGSRFRIADETFEKLLDEVAGEDYLPYPYEKRLCCEQLTAFAAYEHIDILNEPDRVRLARFLSPFVPEAEKFAADIHDFLHIEPKLPEANKAFEKTEPICIGTDWDRAQITEYLRQMRPKNLTADLAFYACRDMDACCWRPFLAAAMQRCPVSIEQCKDRTAEQVCKWLLDMPNESIYDGKRLAQPDEVANYNTGDGVEKALTMANILCSRDPKLQCLLNIEADQATVSDGHKEYNFLSSKTLSKKLRLSRTGQTEL